MKSSWNLACSRMAFSIRRTPWRIFISRSMRRSSGDLNKPISIVLAWRNQQPQQQVHKNAWKRDGQDRDQHVNDADGRGVHVEIVGNPRANAGDLAASKVSAEESGMRWHIAGSIQVFNGTRRRMRRLKPAARPSHSCAACF